MKTNFSLLFYLKKPKNYTTGPVPIYLRITVNGKRAEATTSRTCDPAQWNSKTGRLKGTKESSRTFNAYLDTLKYLVYATHESLTAQQVVITAERLKNVFIGKPDKIYTIVDVFKEHNNQIAALVGTDFAKGTLERYKTSLKHTQDFIKWKYNVIDIDVKEIDHEFVVTYDFYLRSVRKCANNSAVKYLKNFKKIIRICIASGWMINDPFVNYKAKVKVVDRLFLNNDELQRMAVKEFATERLGQIRDIFLFSCFTGLAYADVQKLKSDEIITGPDGEKWINTKRQKTAIPTRVPLLPPAVAILNRYSDSPVCEHSGKALPVSTNQKMDAYLKEIADICGIAKKLTYHIARHTFATTVTLSNGVPIESVSKMLGHTNIKTTQHYAKILDMKVAQDMSKLRQLY
jgi:site-specific recombinase XerD